MRLGIWNSPEWAVKIFTSQNKIGCFVYVDFIERVKKGQTRNCTIRKSRVNLTPFVSEKGSILLLKSWYIWNHLLNVNLAESKKKITSIDQSWSVLKWHNACLLCVNHVLHFHQNLHLHFGIFLARQWVPLFFMVVICNPRPQDLLMTSIHLLILNVQSSTFRSNEDPCCFTDWVYTPSVGCDKMEIFSFRLAFLKIFIYYDLV